MKLKGKVAAVTGGGSGIGAAICRRFAAEGATVAVLDVRVAAAEQMVGELGAGLAVAADVSDSAAVDAAVAQVERGLGPLDVLVNNAGAVGAAHMARVAPLTERQRVEAAAGQVVTPLDALVRISDEEWRRMLAIHLDGTFYCTRAAVRSKAPRGSGVIVNMSSICGIEGCTGHPHYSAAKAAILGFTRSGAKELIVQGMRMNAIAPGFVDTSSPREPGAGRTRWMQTARSWRPAPRPGGWRCQRRSRTRPSSWRPRTPRTSSARPSIPTAAY
jgi:3-oxoacyl-[acyl-carrier protein] reductase